MLFRRLYNLRHQLFQALVVCQNSEVVAEEILSPLLHRDSDGKQLPDISGGS